MRATLVMLVAALLLVVTTARAQYVPEVRPFLGAYVPTGSQRDELKNAVLVGGQLAIEVRRTVHLVGTLAYATPRPARNEIGSDVHMFQYDVGAEVFRVMPLSDVNAHWTFRPFVGAGLGARTHDFYDRKDLDAKPVWAGYGALGVEVQHETLALRFEARDYLTGFKGLLGDRAATARNDMMLAAGLVLHLR